MSYKASAIDFTCPKCSNKLKLVHWHNGDEDKYSGTCKCGLVWVVEEIADWTEGID